MLPWIVLMMGCGIVASLGWMQCNQKLKATRRMLADLERVYCSLSSERNTTAKALRGSEADLLRLRKLLIEIGDKVNAELEP